MTFNRNSERVALHARQMFAHVVAKLCIQRKRSCVKSSLNEPDTGEILLCRALMHRFHQTPANRAILHRRIDRNRSNACDRVAFIEKIAADNPPIDFCNHRIKFWICE